MQAKDAAKLYKQIWNDFTNSLDKYRTDVAAMVKSSDELCIHDILREIYYIPKHKIAEYLRKQPYVGTPNPGSATGLFFEIIIADFVIPYIEKRFKTIKIMRNSCDDEDVRAVKRDPDLYIEHNGKKVVIEIKVAPKKSNIESIIRLKEQFNKINVGFYLIGGWIAINKNELEQLASNNWISILDGSDRNIDIIKNKFRKVDDLLEDICNTLENKDS